MKITIPRRFALAFIALFAGLSALAQTSTITGVVRDSQNQPVVGAAVMVKGKTAVPTTPYGKFRITCMPEYYRQEPLDWRNDNYFSNQIYTLNADNLNTIIDPEFEAREKTIFTKDATDATKVKEQEMIGFYTIAVEETEPAQP